MTTWEYKVVALPLDSPPTLEAALNRHGRDGWELVGTPTSYVAALLFFFRRALGASGA